MMGKIDTPLRQPASIYAYAEGITYAILIEHPLGNSLLHSGAFLPSERIPKPVDNLFLCTPGLQQLSPAEQEAFYQKIILSPGVRRVIPVHWYCWPLVGFGLRWAGRKHRSASRKPSPTSSIRCSRKWESPAWNIWTAWVEPFLGEVRESRMSEANGPVAACRSAHAWGPTRRPSCPMCRPGRTCHCRWRDVVPTGRPHGMGLPKRVGLPWGILIH